MGKRIDNNNILSDKSDSWTVLMFNNQIGWINLRNISSSNEKGKKKKKKNYRYVLESSIRKEND